MKSKPVVYLIEDDLDDQYLFKSVMKELDIQIELTTFDDGLSAYQALTRVCNLGDEALPDQLPDLILLDLNLPVWDGKKTLSELKKVEGLQAIPIVIYTTSKSEYDVEDCYELGANSFISKAAEYDNLLRQIKSMCTYWFTTVTL